MEAVKENLDKVMFVDDSSSSSSAAPRCRVSLHVGAVRAFDGGYSITAVIEDAVQLPRELFVFQRRPVSGERDEFSHVASPSDIEEYSAGAPAGGASFYRAARVTFIFRDPDLLVRALWNLKRDICLLIESFEAMHVFNEQTVGIG